MANLARTLKSPYLSPRFRSSMSNRTMPSSPDFSLTSPNSPLSDYFGDLVAFGRDTETLASGRPGFSRDGNQGGEDATPPNFRVPDDDDRFAPGTSSSFSTLRSRSRARSKVIEVPQPKHFSTAPACTPPEPLSARGTYFSFHEDRNGRIHHPHSFQHQADARMSRLIAESGPVYAGHPTPHPAQSALMASSNTPVASYLAPGFYDSPLPMGKYYPSNFESRGTSQSMLHPALAGTLSSNISPDSKTIPLSHLVTPETELHRKLQLYRRDIFVQASMAASELLTNPANSSNKLVGGVSINSLSLRGARLPAQTPHKPRSPRLLPLDSPGPVTPMYLEPLGGGDYLIR
ncbi:hypothetical protein B0J13DRAFT_586185 [Dactylonectria estremocensis]|uniref:Uncharacterized protein n=1 Tax=Dactylonectria estremocensis TaxID=1079267 RepID=A0A9P9EMP3_9HYPO|nr:hypothetical protein B0J13DRAFT_586185 [Dactylonectria estremocensis]